MAGRWGLLLVLLGLVVLVEVEGREGVDERVVVGEQGLWDYLGEETASRRRKRGAGRGEGETVNKEEFLLSESEEKTVARGKAARRKEKAIRINEGEETTRNSTSDFLVEDPPGIGLGHVLGREGNVFFSSRTFSWIMY